MRFYQRAFRYLWKKKAKTALLFLVLLVVNCMILGTTIILRATQEAKISMHEKTKSKILIEMKDRDLPITNSEAEQLHQLNGVVFVNRLADHWAYPENFNLATQSQSEEEENLKVSLSSYDDLEYDSAFAEQTYRLMSGTYINQEHPKGIVINSSLAELNGLNVGAQLKLKTAEGRTVCSEIIGIYYSGGERLQSESMLAAYRIENKIFIDNATFSKLFGQEGFSKVSVYTDKPEQLDELENDIYSMFKDRAEIITSDILYRQMKAPLEQILRVTKLMFLFAVFTGVIVVSLLLCMWMRTRRRETAIFISMGETKKNILFQVFLESSIVFFFAILGACGLGNIMANSLQNLLFSSQMSEFSLDMLIQFKDIVTLLGIGGLVVMVAVGSSLIPTLMAKPSDTLSKMEG